MHSPVMADLVAARAESISMLSSTLIVMNIVEPPPSRTQFSPKGRRSFGSGKKLCLLCSRFSLLHQDGKAHLSGRDKSESYPTLQPHSLLHPHTCILNSFPRGSPAGNIRCTGCGRGSGYTFPAYRCSMIFCNNRLGLSLPAA